MKAYRLLVEINGIQPRVWRRILVPAGHDFFGLHAAIQISFGWLDFHLFRFSFLPGGTVITENLDDFEEYRSYQEKYKGRIPSSEEDPDGSIGQILSKNMKQPTSGIELYLEQYKTFSYTYDFKDLWEHK
ncbi:MAG: plasmid pRiA4b ORF-3 family protein, partial [Eubacteriales bacterium]|nr:plasmid pRiA4b ORF-3 family protein [Eubacteriales bacterium]